jgi:hypothetical protein
MYHIGYGVLIDPGMSVSTATCQISVGTVGASGQAAKDYSSSSCQFLRDCTEPEGDADARGRIAGPRDWPRRIVTEKELK